MSSASHLRCRTALLERSDRQETPLSTGSMAGRNMSSNFGMASTCAVGFFISHSCKPNAQIFFSTAFVGCRAFTTSQSAGAHLILHRMMFEIAEADTGQSVKFRYLHGSGYDTWSADAHKGQALGEFRLAGSAGFCLLTALTGLGLYLQEISRNNNGICPEDPAKRWCDLTPYEHLLYVYRLCVLHFKRKIKELGDKISKEVRVAMLSLSSSQPLPDIDATLDVIRAGGKKAEGSYFLLVHRINPSSPGL